MLKFQHDDVIIYDISRDFEIVFDLWNRLVMSYPYSKFNYDMTINNRDACIFHVFCFIFRQSDGGFSIITSLDFWKFSLTFEITL